MPIKTIVRPAPIVGGNPVRGKREKILLVEDRVKTGTTLNYARQLLLGAGAAVVKTFAVNGNADYCLYNEMCFRFPWRTD